MPIFDKKSLKISYLQSTSTHECYILNHVKANSYLNSRTIHNGATSINLISTTSEAHLPSIDNK